MLKVINNEAPDLCTPCGGKCCKSYPGIYSVDDFLDESGKLDIVKLYDLLVSGLASIDWWEGDVDPSYEMFSVYFVRAATTGYSHVFDPTYGGRCINLASTGCMLGFSERPTQCRELVPGKKACNLSSKDFNKEGLVRGWRPYHDELSIIGKLALEKSN